MKKITIVNADDWMGVYLDGELMREGHIIHADEMLDVIGRKYETIEADEDWIARIGCLPKDLKDVRGV